MKIHELTTKEMIKINGGDEPGYGIGYAIGRAVLCFRAAEIVASSMVQFLRLPPHLF